MPKPLVKKNAPVPLVLTAPEDQTAESTDNNPVVVTLPAPNTTGGGTLTGGVPPYEWFDSPTSGGLFPVGTTGVLRTATDSRGTAANSGAPVGYDVIVAFTPGPDPNPLTWGFQTGLTQLLSLDGNAVVGVWQDSVANGGLQPVVITYKEGGVTKTNGVSTFTVGDHTMTVRATANDATFIEFTFTLRVNEASAGVVTWLRDTHPKLGGTDIAASRTAMLASTPDKNYMIALAASLSTTLSSTTLPRAFSSSGSDTRISNVLWGAYNLALVVAYDPATLRAAGVACPAISADGITLGAAWTQSEGKALVYALLTAYYLPHTNSAYRLPWVDLIKSGQMKRALADTPHGFSGGACADLHVPPALAYDLVSELWTSEQRAVICQAVALKWDADWYDNAQLYRRADSEMAWDTVTSLPNPESPLHFFVGSNEGWHATLPWLLYLAVLNDLEFGSEAFQLEVADGTKKAIQRICNEVKTFSGDGWFHPEAPMNYGTDAGKKFLCLCLYGRSAYVADDPFEQLEENIDALPHYFSALRHENNRRVSGTGGYDYVHHHGLMRVSTTVDDEGEPIVAMCRQVALSPAWDRAQAAADCQWLLDTMGVGTSTSEASYRNAQSILYGPWPRPHRHLLGSAAPSLSTFKRRHGTEWVFMGHPFNRGTRTVTISAPRYVGIHGHGESGNFASLAIEGFGEGVTRSGAEGKGGAFEVVNSGYAGMPAGAAKVGFASGLIVWGSNGVEYSPNSGSRVGSAPYNLLTVGELERAKLDDTHYDFWRYEFTNAWAGVPNVGAFSGAKWMGTFLKDIGVLVDVYIVEGIPTGRNVFLRYSVCGPPTWIGGTVTDAQSDGAFVKTRTSPDATGWLVDNDSGAPIAFINNEVQAQNETNGRFWFTPVLLPSETHELRARGGSKWVAPVTSYEYMKPGDVGDAYSINLPPAEANVADCWRNHRWGEIQQRKTGSARTYVMVTQWGSKDSGHAEYVGASQIAPVIYDGTDAWGLLYPHATTPKLVIFPKTYAKIGVDKAFTIPAVPIPAATMLIYKGLPESSACEVTTTDAGGGARNIILAGAGAMTTESEGTLKKMCSTGGVIS